MKTSRRLVALLLVGLALTACQKNGAESASTATPAATGPSKGIGPITSITLGPIDAQKATQGQQLFQAKCSACHKLDERYVGPALKGVTQRRTGEWILNMILNPVEMTQKDPTAQELLATYLTQMTFQNVSEEEAKSILEYFRQVDAGATK